MAKIPKLGRVIAREDYKDGKHYVTVEWVDKEGYRVIGDLLSSQQYRQHLDV
jgi:hypothetical protein